MPPPLPHAPMKDAIYDMLLVEKEIDAFKGRQKSEDGAPKAPQVLLGACSPSHAGGGMPGAPVGTTTALPLCVARLPRLIPTASTLYPHLSPSIPVCVALDN